jgi:hypothetical protein
MTPRELTSHLSGVHGIERAQVSRAEGYKRVKVLSEISVNAQAGMGGRYSSKRARK